MHRFGRNHKLRFPHRTFAPMSTFTQQKLHPILVRAVAQSLYSIFLDDRYADKVIEHTLRNNPKAGSRDRAFIAETTYEVVRYFRLYSAILGRTPEREADFWHIIGIHFLLQGAPALPEWREWEALHPKLILHKAQGLLETRRFRESIPDWLDDRGAQELGDAWDETLHHLNKQASVVLRTNTLKTNRLALQKQLLEEGVESEPIGDDLALRLLKRQNVFTTKAFRAGMFEVQDYSSQLVAQLLAPAPGMRVVDACAGAGGKALHISALMQGKGSLIALDTVEWKLAELRKRASRGGAPNIETRVIESKKVVKRLYDSADRLLLDVPCSGLGILRRNPDAKWKLKPAAIEQLRELQQEILQSYSPILKPGGRMVYATCSILPSENQDQVTAFLNSPAGIDFRLLEEKRILPQDQGFDGFYMALLEKQSPA